MFSCVSSKFNVPYEEKHGMGLLCTDAIVSFAVATAVAVVVIPAAIIILIPISI